MYKIAIIDKDKDLFSILEEQKELFNDYSWYYFKSLKGTFESKERDNFNLYLIDETIFNSSSFKSKQQELSKDLLPILFIISLNNRKKKSISKKFYKSNVINKPFRLKVLVNIIDDILRFQNKNKIYDISIGTYILEPYEKILKSGNNKKISLTDIEVKILIKLAEYEGEYLNKSVVLNQVWGIKDTARTHTLETHIYRLRKKLSSKFGDKLKILSKTGKYSLIYK